MALLDYQVEPTERLYKILLEKGSALDASDTGTGKTFCAVHAALKLGLPVGILCPKAVIPSWERVCSSEGLKPVFICNYERAVRGLDEFVIRDGRKFAWNFAGLVIWDEVQRCKSSDSLNGRLLTAAWETKFIRCLCLSATAVQNPLEMRALGLVLGLHKGYNFWSWTFKHGAKKNRYNGMIWGGEAKHLKAIHEGIFPGRGVRVRVGELGDAFPDNKIIAEPLQLENSPEIESIYREAEAALDELKAKEKIDMPSAITIMLRARQKTEILKVPLVIELTEDLLREGKSVIIFTNFNDTGDLLASHFKTDCVIRAQDPETRQKNLDDFQSNRKQLIICNIMAGGVGVSLHDVEGNHPRATLLFPTYNAVDFKQALGRAHRSGGKSPVIQRLIYAAGTIEERVCARVQKKLNNIDLINDDEISTLIWNK